MFEKRHDQNAEMISLAKAANSLTFPGEGKQLDEMTVGNYFRQFCVFADDGMAFIYNGGYEKLDDFLLNSTQRDRIYACKVLHIQSQVASKTVAKCLSDVICKIARYSEPERRLPV